MLSPGITVVAKAMAAACLAAGARAFVDGGITGGPPKRPGGTRLFLSGKASEVAEVVQCFEGTNLAAVPVSREEVTHQPSLCHKGVLTGCGGGGRWVRRRR